MEPFLLQTGTEIVELVRDIVLIVFLSFAFLSLLLFTVLGLMIYKRISASMVELTNVLRDSRQLMQRSDRILEDVGEISSTVRRGSSFSGLPIRAILNTAVSLAGTFMKGGGDGGRRRRRRDRDEEDD